MRTRICTLALLLLAGTTRMPAARAQDPAPAAGPDSATVGFLAPIVRGQDYAPPDPVFPLPIGHDRMDRGGFFVALEFLYMHQTNPIQDQIIANRGFYDVDGSIGTALGLAGIPGAFIGSGAVALRSDQVSGPSSYTPGWNATAGWRFRNGLAVEVSWWHLAEAKYTAGASVLPFAFRVGGNLEDTFITAPVFNFPPDFAGPDQKLAIGNPGATFGIWNAATTMQLQFTQRFDQWDITGRIPVYDNEETRLYGIVGPRIVSIWERFKWRTVSMDVNSLAGPTDAADYSNVVSNRLYGFHLGCGDEWRLGDTPVGTFALSCDLQAALLVDFVKTYSKYELEDRSIAYKRSRHRYAIVPELQGQINLWWYPIEAVQLRVGYDAMSFFNTISSPRPVNFDFGSLDPALEHTTRFFHGLNAGIAIIF